MNLGKNAAVLLALLCAVAAPAWSQVAAPSGSFKEVAFEQKLGDRVDLDLVFRDEEGAPRRLGEFFHEGRPVILALVYYECPMLCNMVLNGLVVSLRPLSFDPASDFEVVVVSFDPQEGPALAKSKRDNYVADYGRPGTEAGWHFLTGDSTAIDALTDEVGFRYVYDEERDEYAHASGITILTDDGVLSRYLFGIDYAPKDLKLALTEASDGEVGGVVEQLLLLCYQYDPQTGKYGAAVMFFVRLAGGLTLLALVTFFVLSRRRERRRDQQAVGGTA
jgi:protein SCO1/2